MSTNTSLSSIKERLQALTSKDLPISGGNGTSYEDAIVLDTPGEGMAMSLEGMVTRYLIPARKRYVRLWLAKLGINTILFCWMVQTVSTRSTSTLPLLTAILEVRSLRMV